MSRPTNKQIVDHFYVSTDSKDIYKCLCGAKRKQNIKNGYHNLISHLQNHHSDYEKAVSFGKQSTMNEFASTSKKTSNIYGWLEWTIMESREFSFCEKDLVRKYTKLEPLSRASLMKYMNMVTVKVENEITKDLPTKFGLIIDGWSSGTTHYLAVFACYPSNSPLLAFSPLLNEEDLNAESHVEFIETILTLYNSDLSRILYITGDNCNLNKAIANNIGVPLIGCASHRMNLAVKDYLKDSEDLLDKINILMKKLSTLKGAAALRRKTTLRAVTRNDTRWSSVFKMVERMIEIQPLLTFSQSEYVNLLLSPGEFARTQDLFTVLEDFQSVTLELQKEDITLLSVRVMFDAIIAKYPSMKNYLDSRASIVHSPDFEVGIVKSMMSKDLDIREKLAVAPLVEDSVAEVEVDCRNELTRLSFAQLALKKSSTDQQKKICTNFDHIKPTSNIAERLFSCAGNICTDNRRNMSPVHLEETIFLRCNKKYWNCKTVNEIINN